MQEGISKGDKFMKKRTLANTAAGILSLLTVLCVPMQPLGAICGCAALTVSAEETEAPAFIISVTEATAPTGVLSLGSSFGIHGIITAEQPIARVFGGIYSADGTEQIIYHEETPDNTVFDLKTTFDPVLLFGRLPAGQYLYKIEVSDQEGHTVTAAESVFSVVDNSPLASSIVISRESRPADLIPAGNAFCIRGLIASSFVLVNVRGGVYDADGTPTDVYWEDAPYFPIYDLAETFGQQLSFTELPAGSYTYRIAATDIRGTAETLVEKDFVITEDDSAPSDIQIYDANYPTGTRAQDMGFPVRGIVQSTYPVQSLTGGVYAANGTSQGTVYTMYPDENIFDLTELDKNLTFAALHAGEYVYRVTATDIRGYTKELVYSEFKVRSALNTPDAAPVVMHGMDVSAYQGDIDWNKVYADGIDFAILRAGVTPDSNANYFQDVYFNQYYDAARAAGVKTGVYLYTSASTKSEMKYDIECLLRTLNGRPLDMPVYIDIETECKHPLLGKEALTDIICYGCELLSEQGYRTGVYSGYMWFRDYIDTDRLLEMGCELWLAFWPLEPDTLNYANFCVTWQFTAKGEIDGILGDVDRDYRYAPISAEQHSITLLPVENGTVSVNKTAAGYGERVTLNVTPAEGYAVRSVKHDGADAVLCTNGTYAFSMPEHDVTVSVEFEPKPAEPEEPAETPAVPEYLRGDLDGDGRINVEDAQIVLFAYTDAVSETDSGLSEMQRLAGDINGDGALTIEDAQMILRYYVSNTLSGQPVTWEELLAK
jgi:GH25 family lysozyme M1 (1,4-beta-N-acetylmuramidase)